MLTVPVGTCICCGYPSEIQVRKKRAIVVGCNKSAVQVKPTCPEYPAWCDAPSRCPLYRPEAREKVDHLARVVFDLAEKEYTGDEPVAIYFETSNTSFREAFGFVLEEKQWIMTDGGKKKAWSKIICSPA